MREIEPELLGLVHYLLEGGETYWTSNALTAREASTLYGMIHYAGIERRRPTYAGPERRRQRTSQEVIGG